MPVVGQIIALIGALYALYVLYLGLLHVMRCPPDKAVAYTAVVVVVGIVLAFVVSVVAGSLGFGIGLMPSYGLG